MRKSIIKSMVAGCLAVVIITFLLMAPVFFMSVQKDEIEKIYSEMENTINHIKPLADMAFTYNTRAMNRAFDESMRQYSYFTDSDILFLDEKGVVEWSNRKVDMTIIDRYSSEIFRKFSKSGRIKMVGLMDGIYQKLYELTGKKEYADEIGLHAQRYLDLPEEYTYRSVFFDGVVFDRKNAIHSVDGSV